MIRTTLPKHFKNVLYVSKLFGLIHFRIDNEDKTFAYLLPILFPMIAGLYLFCDIVVEDDETEFSIVYVSDVLFKIINIFSFYTKVGSLFKRRYELKSILTDMDDFNRKIRKPVTIIPHYKIILIFIMAIAHLILFIAQLNVTITFVIAYNLNIVLVPVEFTLLIYILRDVFAQFKSINDGIININSNSHVFSARLMEKWIGYHGQLCYNANRLNDIFSLLNVSIISYTLITTIACCHYINYTIRESSFDQKSGSSITTNMLLFLQMSFLLYEWISIRNEVPLFIK